jgi:hypothetical protein
MRLETIFVGLGESFRATATSAAQVHMYIRELDIYMRKIFIPL